VVFSVDIDPILRPGLENMGASHTVGSAAHLPFANASIDAIATEFPFSDGCQQEILGFLEEAARVMKSKTRMALMLNEPQRQYIEDFMQTAPFFCILGHAIKRRRMDCYLLLYEHI